MMAVIMPVMLVFGHPDYHRGLEEETRKAFMARWSWTCQWELILGYDWLTPAVTAVPAPQAPAGAAVSRPRRSLDSDFTLE